MREHDHPTAGSDPRPSPAAGAPGKRTLTQSLHPRPTATFDRSAEYQEGRATVDASAASAPDARDPGSRLTDEQLRRARRKNPRYQHSLGFDPAIYSSAPVDSDAFALDVANLQAHSLLAVDGIVGPATAAAFGGNAPAKPKPSHHKPKGHPSAAAHIDRDADADDPFALHLLED